MTQNRTFLNWLLLLMMTVGMTSCQGLIDAVFGEADYPAEIPVQPSKPTKQSAIISYATSSIGKSFGDAAFTNVLTNTGDGKVTYATSNAAVATVNSETGEVTITGNGEATITATVADTDKYTYTTKTASYTIGVGTATMTVTAEGFSGTYDGTAHGITVTAPEGATVKYGTAEGTYDLTASPTYTDAGTYTVYYQVKKVGYTTVTGSATVVINKAAGTVSFSTDTVEKLNSDSAFKEEATLTGDGTISGYSSSVPGVATVAADGTVTIISTGTTVITATVTDGTNYKYSPNTATYTLTVKAGGLNAPASYGTGTNPF